MIFLFTAAFQHVRNNLSELEETANDTDLAFLKGLLDNPAVSEAIKVSCHYAQLRGKNFTDFFNGLCLFMKLKHILSISK